MRAIVKHLTAVAVAGLVFVTGCAKPPTEELQAAENAVSRAREAEAPQWAPETFSTAEAKLSEGKGLIDQKKYKEAKPTLEEAAHLADAAAQQASDAKREAEAKRAEEEQAAAEPEPSVKASHTVVKGECLWYIAGYTDVYGDPAQWPQIHRANQDQISDPDLIYPGQTFSIPR